MPRKIIIDTDPGQDDAVAILLALASPELEVVGVVTVAGNVPLERTTFNARQVLELAGRADIPLYAGCVGPMARPLVTAERMHLADELTVPTCPPHRCLQREHGVRALIRLIDMHPGELTLVILGRSPMSRWHWSKHPILPAGSPSWS